MKKIDRRSFLKAACGGLAACGCLMNTNNVMAMANPSAKKGDLSKGNKPWSLVILPDTQKYAEKYPGLFNLSNSVGSRKQGQVQHRLCPPER